MSHASQQIPRMLTVRRGLFDISLLASIASHLAYWADEDVSHFMISQLLARHRVFKGSRPPTSSGPS